MENTLVFEVTTKDMNKVHEIASKINKVLAEDEIFMDVLHCIYKMFSADYVLVDLILNKSVSLNGNAVFVYGTAKVWPANPNRAKEFRERVEQATGFKVILL